MRRILQQSLEPIVDRYTVRLERCVHILSACYNPKGEASLYFLSDSNQLVSPEVEIFIFGTGNPIEEWPDNARYAGTIVDRNFAWHIYYRFVDDTAEPNVLHYAVSEIGSAFASSMDIEALRRDLEAAVRRMG